MNSSFHNLEENNYKKKTIFLCFKTNNFIQISMIPSNSLPNYFQIIV